MSNKIWEVKMTDHGNVWNVRDDKLLGAVSKAIKLEEKFVKDASTIGNKIVPGEPRSVELLCSVDA